MVTDRPGRRLAALAALLGAATLGGCGSSKSGPVRPPSPEGWLAYQQMDGAAYSIRVVGADGIGDQALPGLASAAAYLPSLSLAAKTVAFRGLKDGKTAIILHQWAGDAETAVDVGALDPYAPVLSPDGTKIAFEGVASGAFPRLFTVPVAGGAVTPVGGGDTGTDAGAAWLPDGSGLVFTSNRAGAWDLFLAKLDGSAAERLTTGSKLVGRPSVSPDGLLVAFTRTIGTPATQVVLRSLVDGTEQTLASDAAESEPAFDSTGQRLAVTTEAYGPPCIILRDAATGALVRRLTDRPGLQSAPAFAR